jgi:hypothetical protein
MKYAMLLASTAIRVPFENIGETCETVTINTAAGPARINKADYDEKRHGKLVSAAKEGEQSANMPQAGSVPQTPPGAILPAAPSAPAQTAPGPDQGGPTQPARDPVTGAVAPTTPSQDSVFIMPEGSGKSQRFFLVDINSKKIEHASIDPKGYKSMEDVQEALQAYKRAIPH